MQLQGGVAKVHTPQVVSRGGGGGGAGWGHAPLRKSRERRSLLRLILGPNIICSPISSKQNFNSFVHALSVGATSDFTLQH